MNIEHPSSQDSPTLHISSQDNTFAVAAVILGHGARRKKVAVP